MLPGADGLEIDYDRMAVIDEGREVWVRAYPLSIDTQRLDRAAESSDVAFYEKELLRRRRDHLIIRVDRADLSKNVLRGFTAFDVFLDITRSSATRCTFSAFLQPSRQDVPEYAEYLRRIEAGRGRQHRTARRTGCRSTCGSTRTSTRPWHATSTSTCSSSTRCSTG